MSKPKGMKTRYKTTNWTAYNAALKARGLLTIWLDKGNAVVRACQWQTRPPADVHGCCHPVLPEHQVPLWSGAAPESGSVESLLRMAKLDWRVPDFSTISRRQKTLQVIRAIGSPTTAWATRRCCPSCSRRYRKRSRWPASAQTDLRHQGMPCGHRAARCGGDHPAAKERAAAAICIGRGEGAQRRCAGLQAPGLADMKELELLPPP